MAMQTLHASIWLILLVAAVVVKCNPNITPRLVFQKLKDALIADKNVMYRMQEAFFPSQSLSHDMVFLFICVTVGGVQPGSCGNSSLVGGHSNFTYCQNFQWSSSALVNLISFDQLLILDNVVSESILRIIIHREYIHVPLHIDTVPCETTGNDILPALIQLLPWVKSYARVHGQPNDNDKGYVSISYHTYVNGPYYKRSEACAHLYRLSLLCAFILLNILTPVALGKLVSLYYPRIIGESSTGDFIGCLYWATAIMTFLCNTLYTVTSIKEHLLGEQPAITSCIIYPNCSIPSDTRVYKDELFTISSVATIIPSAVFIELLLSIYAVKYLFGPRSLRSVQHCNFWKRYLLQTSHVLALWNILITLQIFTMILLPLLVLLLIHPQASVLYIIFVLMVPVSLTFIAAYLLHQCLQSGRRCCCNARHCTTRFVHLVVIFAVLGMIIALLVLYELLLTAQAQIETGVKGIVLSLLPSFPLSALGWYLKKRSQKKAQQSPDSTLQPITEQQQATFDNCSDKELLPA